MSYIVSFLSKHKYKLLLILLYTFLFIQMQFIFFYGDDYQVLYPIYKSRNFFSILDYCFDMMHYFWYQWSGRIVGHFTVSFGLSLFGIQFFRILNPIMIFIMLFFGLKIVQLFKKINFEKSLFFISLFFIGCNIYILRETLYWAYSSILYVWGFCLNLLVIYFVLKYYLSNRKIPVFFLIILSVLSFIQTFILEQLSFLIISFLFFILVFSIKNKKKYKHLVILLIITTAGFLISTLAPGNILRVDPLAIELKGYTMLQIILGKTYCFFAVLFNPEIFGIYTSVLFILISKQYIKQIKGKFLLLKTLPIMFMTSYITIVFLDKVFNLNTILFYESTNLDTLQFVNYSTATFILLICYYIVLIFSFFFMIFNTMYKKNKFFPLSLLISFFCIIIPVICIRYIGTRYYLYFIIIEILTIVYYLNDLKIKNITFIELLCIIIVVFPKFIILFLFVILIIYKYYVKKYTKSYEMLFYIILVIEIVLVLVNIGNIFFGYVRNSKIYLLNDYNLKHSSSSNKAVIYEIPYSDALYSWHTNVLDFNNLHVYYGFYLNDFYENYYGVSMDNVFISIENNEEGELYVQ